ncbi:hypothetical protein PC39_13892 [Salinisphaera sp. PC39]|uniref:DUF3299 domain-containing protein n=1 Tax=Salinisphaera sp. PC39 TaxID=1304156 RepID=UPI0033423C14
MNRFRPWSLCAAVLILTTISIPPASIAQARPPAEIEILWERVAPGDGPPTVPAMRGDIVYLAAVVRDTHGQPLDGVTLAVSSDRGNTVLGTTPVTRDGGYAEFNVAARAPGTDRLTVRAGEVVETIRLRVAEPVSQADYAETVPAIAGVEGITSWTVLMAATVDFDAQMRVTAEYGETLRRLAGERVRLAGFMLPLEMGERPTRILLSANPPTCFFHMPGGPTTVVEVRLRDGTDITWDPLVVAGRLTMADTSDDGILYRLTEAEVLAP